MIIQPNLDALLMLNVAAMHVVEPVSPRPGFLAEAVECDNPSSLNPAGNAAASWLFVFFLVNHFENLNSMQT